MLHELEVEIAGGLVTAVIGPNGSGKSSLLKALYGYLPVSEGAIELAGKDLENWSPAELASQLGVCPQEAEPSLDFQVSQLLALRFGGDLETARERLQHLPFLRLEELFPKQLSQLSGGERQRVRLGVALSGNAPWLVLDEPANHLDLSTAWSLFDYLRQPREGGVILALHDLDTAARCCDRILVLLEGSMVAHGSPREVLTPELLARVFELRGRLEAESDPAALRLQGVVEND